MQSDSWEWRKSPPAPLTKRSGKAFSLAWAQLLGQLAVYETALRQLAEASLAFFLGVQTRKAASPAA